MIEKYKEDPILFGAMFVPAVHEKPADFHYDISDSWMRDEDKRVNFIIPCGHGSTTLVSILLTLHKLVFGNDERIVLCSYKKATSVHNIDNILQILNSDDFIDVFGNLYNSGDAIKGITLNNGNSVIAKGAGQDITGLMFDYRRPTMFVLDDIDYDHDHMSRILTYRLPEWIECMVEDSLDSKRGRIFSIGTPKTKGSILNYIADCDSYTTFRYPAEKDPNNKIALWPEWVSWDELKTIEEHMCNRGVGYLYDRQYLCNLKA